MLVGWFQIDIFNPDAVLYNFSQSRLTVIKNEYKNYCKSYYQNDY